MIFITIFVLNYSCKLSSNFYVQNVEDNSSFKFNTISKLWIIIIGDIFFPEENYAPKYQC